MAVCLVVSVESRGENANGGLRFVATNDQAGHAVTDKVTRG